MDTSDVVYNKPLNFLMRVFIEQSFGRSPARNPRIYGITNYRGNSGHYLTVLTMEDGRIIDITKAVSTISGRRLHPKQGVYVSGFGHSHIGAIADDLTHALKQYDWKIEYESLSTVY